MTVEIEGVTPHSSTKAIGWRPREGANNASPAAYSGVYMGIYRGSGYNRA
jgi:hypothetical protein